MTLLHYTAKSGALGNEELACRSVAFSISRSGVHLLLMQILKPNCGSWVNQCSQSTCHYTPIQIFRKSMDNTNRQALRDSEQSVALPQFWTSDAEGWFNQAEAQFRLSGVLRENDRFNLTWSSLPPDISRLCHDVYLNRSSHAKPYQMLKAEVLRVTNVAESSQNNGKPGDNLLLRTGFQKEYYE